MGRRCRLFAGGTPPPNGAARQITQGLSHYAHSLRLPGVVVYGVPLCSD